MLGASMRGGRSMLDGLLAHPPAQLVSLRAFQPLAPSPWTAARGRARLLANLAAARGPGAALAAAHGGPVSLQPAAARVDALFARSRSPVLLLERSVGERIAADGDLWATGCFQGEVYPDLPIATTWRDLVQRLFNLKGLGAPPAPAGGAAGVSAAVAGSAAAGAPSPPEQQQQQHPWYIPTVAAQCRSRDQLRAFMLAAAGVDFMGDTKGGNSRPADALLFVSGSHPARNLPAAGRWLQDSFDLLQLAATMREQGYLPASISLWAVENPMTTPVSRLQGKLDAGAEVVLTQPPLIWGRAEQWMQEADVLRLADQGKIVVGVPMVSSAGNLDFWLRLCRVRELPEAEVLLAAFPRQGDLGKPAFDAAVRQWNADFIQKVLDLPGVAGLHVMPLTKVARQMAADFLRDGTLPNDACPASVKGAR